MLDDSWRKKFDQLWKIAPPGQGKLEFYSFLIFVKNYLALKGVLQPVVVEIGVKRGYQRAFYKELLDADYYGIDLLWTKGSDYIMGDSGEEDTRDVLESRLGGRKIDLLFIDGNHSYVGVKSDWGLYRPLTEHLIAIHDILWPAWGVKDFWRELCGFKYPVVEFKCPQKEFHNKDDGLGVVLL